jgi:putative RNA 2'-phosphotransferase
MLNEDEKKDLVDDSFSNDDDQEFNNIEKEKNTKGSKLSKFLTLVLRHQPGALNLELDNDGWLNCTVDELVSLLNEKHGFENIVKEDIEEIVNNDPKGRYEIHEDLIRATYGHSVKVVNPLEFPDDIDDLPEFVYYATNNYQLDTMLRLGLIPREKRDRQFLHLSVEIKDAYTVAKHHSRNPKLVRIDVRKAHEYGVKFRKVAPFIVICDEVPSQFIEEIPLPEELQYLTHLNPERKYQKYRGHSRGRSRSHSNRRYSNDDKRSFRGKKRNYRSYGSSRDKPYQKSHKKRFHQNREGSKENNSSNDDLDLDSPAEFGDIDDIKKKAQSKSTIHFETEKDEDVDFS